MGLDRPCWPDGTGEPNHYRLFRFTSVLEELDVVLEFEGSGRGDVVTETVGLLQDQTTTEWDWVAPVGPVGLASPPSSTAQVRISLGSVGPRSGVVCSGRGDGMNGAGGPAQTAIRFNAMLEAIVDPFAEFEQAAHPFGGPPQPAADSARPPRLHPLSLDVLDQLKL